MDVEKIFLGVGFAQLVNHGLRDGIVEEAFGMMERLFALPLETKMHIAKEKSPFFRGYEGVGAEVTNGKVDYREQVDTWTDMTPSPLRQPPYERLKGPSQYFSDQHLPGYKALTQEFMGELSNVGHDMMQMLALSLGQSEDLFLQHFGEEAEYLHRLKWCHYPKPAEDLEEICGVHEHKDSGFITFVLPWRYPGLEVEVASERGLPPHFEGAKLTQDDAIVVNLGKSLQALTNGCRALTHVLQQSPHPCATAEPSPMGIMWPPRIVLPSERSATVPHSFTDQGLRCLFARYCMESSIRQHSWWVLSGPSTTQRHSLLLWTPQRGLLGTWW